MSTAHKRRQARFSAWPVIFGLLGFIATVVVLIASGEGSLSEQIGFVFRNPAGVVWETLIATLVGASAAIFPALLAEVRSYPTPSGPAWWQLIWLGGLMLLLFVILLLAHNFAVQLELPVHQPKTKILLITAFVCIPFVLCQYGMLSVAQAVDVDRDPAQSTSDAISAFLANSRVLQWYVFVAGLIVGGAALTTGALQHAIAALNPGASVNPSTVLSYGAFGSATIAVYYIPVYAALQRAARRLCDDILPLQREADDYISWFEKRAKLESFLGLNRDWLDSLKTSLVLLTPLAGSAVSLLVGKAQ